MGLSRKSLFVAAGISVLTGCSDTVVVGSDGGQKEFSVPGTPNPQWWKASPSQNWGDSQQMAFWFAPQGSWMVPYDWFVVLEQTKDQTRFADNAHMTQLGYIPWGKDADWNPDALPIGFTRSPWTAPDDGSAPVSWLGPNCSACHTAKITYKGTSSTIVNGAPSRGDFLRLNYEIEDALVKTVCDAPKFSRFLAAVNARIGHETVKGVSQETEDSLRKKMKQEIDYLARYIDNNLLGKDAGISQSIADTIEPDGKCKPASNFKSIAEYADKIGKISEVRAKLIQKKSAETNTPPGGRDPWVTILPNKELMASVPVLPGKARVDAVGAIFNEVAAVAIDAPENIKLANAPVRYPYLWGTPQSAVVQWSGFANNDEFAGPLGRNAGEVLGVHGRVNVPPYDPKKQTEPYTHLQENDPTLGYSSSILMGNIGQIERWLSQLSTPAWPGFLPAIDPALRDRGEAIFSGNAVNGVKCVSCHENVRDSKKEFYRPTLIQTSVIGTDAMMVDNLALKVNPATLAPWSGGKLQPTPLPDRFSALEALAGKAVLGKVLTAVPSALHSDIYSGPKQDAFDARSYKARPLYGIWAAAPYLHNGSVASLKELLTPEGERKAAFKVGSTEYDPDAVGYSADSCIPGSEDCLDTTLPGNRNTGHSGTAYGTELPDQDRKALLEYLKSL